MQKQKGGYHVLTIERGIYLQPIIYTNKNVCKMLLDITFFKTGKT